MKGEKLSLLQRCIKWREANIKEKQCVCCVNIEIFYPSDTEFPD